MLAKPLILVGISFLVVALIYGPSSTFHVFSSSQLDEVAPEVAPTPPPPPPPIGLPKIGGEAAPQIGGEATEQPTAPGADEGTAARSVGGGAPPGGWCSGVDMNTCIPCDPGTSSSDPEAGGPAIACMPEECWNPAPGDECEAEECEGNICWPVPQMPQPPLSGIRTPQVPLQQLETEPSRVVPPIAEEGIQETPPEPLPPCPEGQELDEESGTCVPIESPTPEQPEETAAQEPDQPESQEEQPSEGDNSEENGGS